MSVDNAIYLCSLFVIVLWHYIGLCVGSVVPVHI